MTDNERAVAVRKVALGLSLLTMSAPSVSLGLGLGDITVASALNQPLQAQIQVLSLPVDQLDEVKVQLAPRTAFANVGVERVPMLSQLKFSTSTDRNGRPVITVTSTQPVREPFLDFLVQVEWPKGRLLREYTILLDPPVVMDTAAQVPVFPAVASPGSSARSGAERPSIRPSPIAETVQRPREPVRSADPAASPAGSGATPETYFVKRGDTLGAIAERFHDPSSGASIQQTMMAYLRKNPEAFIDSNVNNLKAGYVLRIPDAMEVRAEDRVASVRELSRQTALWRQYRDRLAENMPLADALPTAPGQVPESVVTDDEVPAPGDVRDLEILAADESTDAEGGEAVRAEMALTQELIRKQQEENQELRSRVGELESMLVQQDRIINLQSEQLAELKRNLESWQQPASVGLDHAVPVGTSDTADSPVAPPLGESAGQVEPSVPVAPAADSPVSAEAALEDLDPVLDLEADLGLAEGDGEMEEAWAGDLATDAPAEGPMVASANPLAEPSATPAESSADKPMPAEHAAAVPPVWSRFINDLLSNPVSLAAIGGTGLVALALLGFIVSRSRRKDEADSREDLDALVAGALVEEALDMDSQDEVESRAMPDTEEGSQTATGDLESEPRSDPSMEEEVAAARGEDDVVAEADVYIAYGMYPQAEELLKQALEQEPGRTDYRMKLLETYHGSKNQAAFVDEAQALYDLGPDRDDWNKVVTMGRLLSPDHPLFNEVSGGSVDEVAEALPAEAFGSDQLPNAADLDIEVGEAAEGEGGLSTEMAQDAVRDPSLASGVVAASTEAADPAEDESVLEFDVEDLDLDLSRDTSDSEADIISPVEDAETLDFDLSELDIETAAASGETAEETADDVLEIDLSVDDDVLAELSREPGVSEEDVSAPVTSVADSESTTIDVDLESLDLPTIDDDPKSVSTDALDTVQVRLPPQEGELSTKPGQPDTEGLETLVIDEDLDGLAPVPDTVSVDLPTVGETQEEGGADRDPAATELPAAEGDSDEVDQDAALLDEILNADLGMEDLEQDVLLDTEDEVGTKLDLARAYIDMGDPDGARSTLQEVILEGDDGQREEAQHLLRQIA